MAEGPNPQSKWAKYKIDGDKLVRADFVPNQDVVLVYSWLSIKIENLVVNVAIIQTMKKNN